ncbi:MAG: chemotaxis protein CheA [Gammaproteobacteria bacterium]|nr:chemotaxis protein CheA [Gammaproteobacteria bacterium]
MSIDMSQFLETFYEESFEGLEIMETELLALDTGDADSETINTIFRAAHSIKGGSGTFGLNAVADFTHVMETLLDEMRDGKRQITQEAVNLLLTTVDVLREMLTALRENTELDHERIKVTHDQLEALLASDSTAAKPVSQADTMDTSSSTSPTAQGWKISFHPHIDLLKTGNDPVRILRELSELGEIESTMDASSLPDFENLDPEECHLGWDIELKGEVKREDIDEVFAWVEDECDLTITAIKTVTEKVAPAKEEISSATEQSTVTNSATKASGEAPKATPAAAKAKTSSESASIRVGIDKVDSVINLVGELVITQSMLSTLGEDFDMSKVNSLIQGMEQLELNTRELQEQVMRMRMMPINFAFQRFPRLVHDMSQKMGKNIELKMTGEQTELDKTVMEKIGDPLVHLVRNSLDHGIEMPEQRKAAGKPVTATLGLNAYHQGGNIVIEVTDDGAGLNEARVLAKAIEQGLVSPDAELESAKIHELILLPGFSTAETITDVSGRGVGMDVVVKNIRSLGGTLEVWSKQGEGSKFTIRLPLTLAILDGQTVAVGDEDYIIPLISIIESIQLKPEMLNVVVGKGETFKLRDEHLPIIRLHNVFGGHPRTTDLTQGLLVVVETDGRKIGLFVDELKGQQQVVIKSLEVNYKRIEGISGATILGDGSVALIIDIPGLISLSNQEKATSKYKKSA